MSEIHKEFLVDFTVNVYETIAGFSLILGLFRFSFNKTYFINTVIAAIVMAQTSYLLRFPLEMPYITSVFMLAWIVVFLWRLFRIHPFYALLMAVTGYMTYVTVQDITATILGFFVDIEKLATTFYLGKSLQFISSTLSLIIYFILAKKRIGYSFVPDQFQFRIRFDTKHRMLLAIIIISSVLICFISLLVFKTIPYFPVITLFMLFALYYLNYLNERSRTM